MRLIGEDHPLNDEGHPLNRGPMVRLDGTRHRDGTITLKVNEEMLGVLCRALTGHAGWYATEGVRHGLTQAGDTARLEVIRDALSKVSREATWQA